MGNKSAGMLNIIKDWSKTTRKEHQKECQRLLNGEYLNEVEKYNMSFPKFKNKIVQEQELLNYLDKKEAKRKWKRGR